MSLIKNKRLIFTLATSLLIFSGCGSTTNEPPKETASMDQVSTSESENENSNDSKLDVTIQETVVFDENGIKITATGIKESFMGTEITFLLENNSTQDITIQARNVSVNGYMVDTSMSSDITIGKKSNDTLTLLPDSLKKSGITQVADIEFSFYIFDSTSWETVVDTDLINIQTSASGSYTQEYDDSGEILYDQDSIRIISKGMTEDSIFGPYLQLYIENNSGDDITVQVRDTSINGFMVNPSCSADIIAGKKSVTGITFLSTELEESNIETIENIETSFHVFNLHNMDTIFDTVPITINF